MRSLINVIAFPFGAFKQINHRPTWLAPMVIAAAAMIAANAVYYWRVNPNWEQRVRARIEQQRITTGQTMSPEQIEKQVQFARITGRLFIGLPMIIIPGFCLVVSSFYFLAFGIAFLSPPPYKKMFSVVAWSEAATRVIEALIIMLVLIAINKEKLQELDPTLSSLLLINVGAFLPGGTSPPIKALASSLDLFGIWFLILLTIGFAKIAEPTIKRFSTWKAAALVFGVWAAWVLMKVGLKIGFGY